MVPLWARYKNRELRKPEIDVKGCYFTPVCLALSFYSWRMPCL